MSCPIFVRRIPPAPDFSPPGTGLSQFVALVTRHRDAVSARSPYGLSSIPPTTPWPGHPAYLGSYSLALTWRPTHRRSRAVSRTPLGPAPD
ncbi:hypothetical protein MTO96_019517 [Rhipicephalus appendiculatus]